MSLQIPARRSRRLQHREENVQQPEQPIETTYSTFPTKQKPLQTLVLNKRRRIGNRERDLELEAVRCFVLSLLLLFLIIQSDIYIHILKMEF